MWTAGQRGRDHLQVGGWHLHCGQISRLPWGLFRWRGAGHSVYGHDVVKISLLLISGTAEYSVYDRDRHLYLIFRYSIDNIFYLYLVICKEGWSPFAGLCYMRVASLLSWPEARQRCQEEAGVWEVMKSYPDLSIRHKYATLSSTLWPSH